MPQPESRCFELDVFDVYEMSSVWPIKTSDLGSRMWNSNIWSSDIWVLSCWSSARERIEND